MLFDAHNHLQDPALAPYLPEVARDLAEIGLTRAVVNGTGEDDWERVAALAETYPWVVPSYGLHPWRVGSQSPDWRERLKRLVKGGGAVGEIGLDRWIEGFDFEAQTEAFRFQLVLAARLNRPVSLHCLKAWGALWEILRTEPVPECGFLLHSYGGPPEMVGGFVKRGAYFSFSGHFLQPRKAERREVFRNIPTERLLVETDAPDMPPPPERIEYALPEGESGRVLNHPANLRAVYAGLAELRGCSVQSLTAQAAENFERLFGSGSAGTAL